MADTVFICTYCGKPVPDGCAHPNVFSCCGEVGRVEEVKVDEPKRGGPIEKKLRRLSVAAESGCHVWTGAKNEHGYGKVHHEGRARKAHRVAWEVARGPIPQGINVLHRCDNPACINVDHLFLGTQIDNIEDAMAKGRVQRVRGMAKATAKLSDADVLAIRGDQRTYRTIANQYGISSSGVSRVKARLLWGHVEEVPVEEPKEKA